MIYAAFYPFKRSRRHSGFRVVLSLAVYVFAITCLLAIARPHTALAISGSDFQAGHIIDDAVFENNNAMSVQQIQNFLNSKVGTCDTYGTESFTAPNGQVMTHAQWGAENGNPEPFTCINEYIENPNTLQNNFSNPTGNVPGGESAAQIIYNAAQQYGINPEVILVTLQKEQGLVTDNWPWYSEYQYAMGYACPDSAGCNSSDADFYSQVDDAAWQFRDYLNNPGAFNYWIGDDYIQYNPSTSCGGSVVDIQNAATAALYIYTPYQPNAAALANVSSTSDGGTGNSCSAYGNRNFWWYFTTWFGSTTYNEPADSELISGNQSGNLYFVSLDNNTMYHIPTWSTLYAYGLNNYQIMPMNDSDFDTSYTNGGTLKTLVFDNDDQKVYLVDGGQKFWFQQYCSQWGLDCLNSTPGDVTFLTSTYFDDFVNYGGLGRPIQESNGIYYLMVNGTKEPFADLTNMEGYGYSTSQSIPIAQSDLNSTQPLGPLLLANPTFIQFPPNAELLYFDGQNYHYVSSYNTYLAWGGPPITHPPTSTYNTTLPTLSGSNLGIWVNDGNGNDYLVDSGNKINISSHPTNWYNGSYQTFSNTVLNTLPTVSAQPNVDIDGSIYVVQNGALRHVPTYDDYVWLGINPSNTLNLSPNTGIPTGVDVLRDAAFYTVSGNPGLYMINNGASLHVPTIQMADDYGVNWSNVRYNLNPNVLSQGYPSSSNLTRWVIPTGGELSYVSSQTLVSISSSAAAAWGITSSGQPVSNMDLAGLYNVTNTRALGQFVLNEDNGGVYYGSGGTYHYIASYNTFVNLGGLNAPLIGVYSDFFSGLTQGSTYN